VVACIDTLKDGDFIFYEISVCLVISSNVFY
jgi:hypothetical protein